MSLRRSTSSTLRAVPLRKQDLSVHGSAAPPAHEGYLTASPDSSADRGSCSRAACSPKAGETNTCRETPPVAGRRRWGCGSTLDAIVKVGDTVALEDPGALKLDVLGSEVVEKAAPSAEEQRDQMDLEFVEDAGSECELRGAGTVDQHVLVAGSLLGLGHRGSDVGHVAYQRPRPRGAVGPPAGEDEDRHAVVVVAAPAVGRVEGAAAGDHRPGGHELVVHLAIHTRRASRDT